MCAAHCASLCVFVCMCGMSVCVWVSFTVCSASHLFPHNAAVTNEQDIAATFFLVFSRRFGSSLYLFLSFAYLFNMYQRVTNWEVWKLVCICECVYVFVSLKLRAEYRVRMKDKKTHYGNRIFL